MVADAVSKPFDELYGYDVNYCLKEMSRGILNSSHDAISSQSLDAVHDLDL